MLESIAIKNVASFCAEGISIDSLKKVNFIYGANGCGKTTISNYLHDCSPTKYENCSHNWDSDGPMEVLVYNKEFRDRNFGESNIKGIFTLGEATKEEIELIEEKNIQLKGLRETLKQRKEALEKQVISKTELEDEFRESAWQKIYKKYEDKFKPAFAGSIGKKESFKLKILEQHANNTMLVPTLTEIEERTDTIFGEAPVALPFIETIKYGRLVEIEEDPIWQKIVVGSANVEIAGLIQRLNISDWVATGREYVEDETCPFCQRKTITQDLKSQLQMFFDEDYIKDLKKIENLGEEYLQIVEAITNYLNDLETDHKNIPKTKLALDKLSTLIRGFLSHRTANIEIISHKLSEPSRVLQLANSDSQFLEINELLTNANRKHITHNKLVADFKNEKERLVTAIWRFVIHEFSLEIATYVSKASSLSKAIEGIQEQVDVQEKKVNQVAIDIQEKSKNITSIAPTVAEINKLLASFGFSNFQIVPSQEEGFYQIERDNGEKVENNLSEGEVTFMTFLYYLQRAKGGETQQTVNRDRILVIDDPISSLDSNVLFVVSSLIKRLIKEVKEGKGKINQIILLTHNVYFHKEVSYEGRNGNGSQQSHWILRKKNGNTNIHFYGTKNPIQSSYELLWKELREWEGNSGITIQNAMRRIIENFFSILGNRRDEYIIDRLDTPEEREICRSLLCWINEGSHTLPDDFYVELPHATIENYQEVFKKIFIHTENVGHYNLMMKIEDGSDEPAMTAVA